MGVRIFDFFQYLDVYLSIHKNSPRNLCINFTVQILFLSRSFLRTVKSTSQFQILLYVGISHLLFNPFLERNLQFRYC